jgi:hypothetical protein
MEKQPMFMAGRSNLVKMATLPKRICKFNVGRYQLNAS